MRGRTSSQSILSNSDILGDDVLPEVFIKPAHTTTIKVKAIALIYNPKSGAKKGEKRAKKAVQFLSKHEIAVDLFPTQKRNHAEELCQTLNVDKYDVICLLGGDGTLHEAINGYMRRTDDAKSRIPLAVLPGGTGNSFVLELQGIVDFDSALQRIVRGITVPIDLAEVFFPTAEDKIYLFNSLHWGMASKVNVKAEQLRWMGKAIRYTTAALLEIVQGEMTSAIVEIIDKDGKRIRMKKNQYSFCIANNICTAAKGMKLAPDAKLNDGLIDLLLFRSDHMKDLAQVFRKFYDGTHTQLDFVDYFQVKSFLIIPLEKENADEEEQEVLEEILDIDGELKGIAPFKCTVLPRALRVIA